VIRVTVGATVFCNHRGCGKEARRILNAGLADGLESLTERPPAITALLQQLEAALERRAARLPLHAAASPQARALSQWHLMPRTV
jgi:hypothetical protein